MNKKLIAAVVGILLIGGISYGLKVGVFSRDGKSQPTTQSNKIKVVASFYPLAHFAEQVGKAHIEVTNITPAGAEPHDYEPTPKEIASIYTAKLLITNGAGLDIWADKIKPDLQAQGVEVATMSDQFQLLKGADEESVTDPHIWLDPALAEKEVTIIRDALIKVDPQSESDYRKNADDYIAQITSLDKQYSEGLAQCTTRDVVTSHAAFGYMAKHYNLNQIAIAGISPEEEPSSQRMAQIAQLAKEKNIKYIFFETLVSPKLADTIATEVGAKTIVFNPLEGLTDDEIKSGKTYISVMQENLSSLRTALQCK
jgi:zinc transport system substrate-binding protein